MERKRRTQAEKRDETREQILAAASRVFAGKGFHAASLDAIADEAGYSRGAVYYNFANKEELFLELLDRRCAERAQDLRETFTGDSDDIGETSRQAEIASQQAFDAMTGDTEWRALFLEFLAHAARNRDFRKAFGKRADQMRSALNEVVVQRTAPVADALPMPPEQLAVVLDALGLGLWAQHMLHGAKDVPPDLFANAVGLIVDGIAARAGVSPAERVTAMKTAELSNPRFARMYMKAAARAERRGAEDHRRRLLDGLDGAEVVAESVLGRLPQMSWSCRDRPRSPAPSRGSWR